MGFRYDAHTFQHPGRAMSLEIRGQSSGGGRTLGDPFLLLYAGGVVPAGGCGNIGQDNGSGCGLDAYLSTSQPAGTYTVLVSGLTVPLGTYTLEINTFAGPNNCRT